MPKTLLVAQGSAFYGSVIATTDKSVDEIATNRAISTHPGVCDVTTNPKEHTTSIMFARQGPKGPFTDSLVMARTLNTDEQHIEIKQPLLVMDSGHKYFDFKAIKLILSLL